MNEIKLAELLPAETAARPADQTPRNELLIPPMPPAAPDYCRPLLDVRPPLRWGIND
jgi:hypothetical protein